MVICNHWFECRARGKHLCNENNSIDCCRPHLRGSLCSATSCSAGGFDDCKCISIKEDDKV